MLLLDSILGNLPQTPQLRLSCNIFYKRILPNPLGSPVVQARLQEAGIKCGLRASRKKEGVLLKWHALMCTCCILLIMSLITFEYLRVSSISVITFKQTHFHEVFLSLREELLTLLFWHLWHLLASWSTGFLGLVSRQSANHQGSTAAHSQGNHRVCITACTEICPKIC